MNQKPDWLKENADGSVDITLAKPADIGGTQVSVVRMREPTVADQEVAAGLSGTDAAREIAVFANLCQITPDDVRKLPLRNYKRLQAAYVGFIE